MNKQIISLQIPVELYNVLKCEAEQKYTTVSALIRDLLVQKYKESLKCQNRVYLQNNKSNNWKNLYWENKMHYRKAL